jgi:signal transduction histidine kinase
VATATRDDRLEALVEAGITIASGLDLATTLTRLVELGRDLTGARYAALGVLDDAGERIQEFITSGIDGADRERIGHPPVGRGLLGALITDARPLRLPDLRADARSVGFPPHHPPMTSFLGVPVKAGDTVFGNLYLTDKQGGDFTQEDEQLIVTLAAQGAVAIENARLYARATSQKEALARAVGELSSIHEIAEAILAGEPRDAILLLVAESARAHTRSDVVAVALPTTDGAALEYVASSGADWRGISVPLERSKLGAAFRSEETVRVDDLRADPDAYGPAVEAIGMRGQIIVPLRFRGESVGVISAGSYDPELRYGDPDARLLEAFAVRAVLAIEIERVIAIERDRAGAERRLAAAELRESARRETLRRVVDAQEQERRRIALELHDETGQALASVLMGLGLVEKSDDPRAAQDLLADLRETVTNAIQELRALAVELRPKALDDFGLRPALERLAETFSRRTGIRVDVHLAGVDGRLPDPVETTVYRVVQEALTNVAKHSGASHASVLVRASGDAVALLVEDDGAGFDPSAQSEGLGLHSMRERAELLSGSFRAESTPESGTTIAIHLPL